MNSSALWRTFDVWALNPFDWRHSGALFLP